MRLKREKLRLQQLDDREAAYTTKAATIGDDKEATVTGTASKEQLAAWHKERVEIESQYDKIILDLRARQIEGQLELVRKGSKKKGDYFLTKLKQQEN